MLNPPLGQLISLGIEIPQLPARIQVGAVGGRVVVRKPLPQFFAAQSLPLVGYSEDFILAKEEQFFRRKRLYAASER